MVVKEHIFRAVTQMAGALAKSGANGIYHKYYGRLGLPREMRGLLDVDRAGYLICERFLHV